MGYRQTYNRITRGANPGTHKFLGKLSRQKLGKPIKVVSRIASPAGVSGLARPLATPKTPKATGRKGIAKPAPLKPKRPTANRSKVAKLMNASNAAAATPNRPGIKGGLLRHARYAAAKLGRRISHVSRSFARHF